MGPAEDLRGTAVVTGGGSARLDLASGLADVEADVPCTPGTRFQLCSVSKLDPYREFLAERIMSPLELTQTTMGGVPPGAARGYSDGQPVAPWNLDVMPGTGDIWSTAGDLTRFTVALHSGELIAASSLRAMRTAHATLSDDDDGEPRLVTTGYGYGIFTGTFAGHTAYYHPGDNPGYQSIACWIPDRAASIVILANDEAASITGLLRQLLPAALGTEATKPGPTSHGRETASPTNP